MGRDSRRAVVVLGTKNDEFERGLRSAEKSAQTWGNRVKGHISKSLRGAFGGLGGVAGLVGVAGFAQLTRDVLKFNEGLVTLQISARKSRGDMLAFNRELQRTASETGASQDELLSGAQKYTELTGKFDEFAASMDTFAKAQVATGASMESLVGAAAALSSNLNVDPSQMLAALDALTAQGKSGKIELRDMAAELPGLTGQFSQFGTVGAKGAVELGAALQVMAQGFGTASETATGMQSLMTAFVKNAGRLKGIGVNVFDKNGKARDFMVVLSELIDKSKGDPRVLQHVLGRQEAVQAIIPFLKEGRVEYERLVQVGGRGGEIMSDFREKSESAPVKMAKAMAQFKAVFNEALMKNLDAIVAAFTSIMKALSWMASHPEAMAALAIAFKGGGVIGTIGGLGMNLSGGGAGGGLGGAAAGGAVNAAGARGLNMLGRGLQGAAVGYALAQTGERLDNGFDRLNDASMTAAGALITMGGAASVLGAAVMAVKFATDMLMSDIDKRQADAAASDLGATAISANNKAFGELGARNMREIVDENGNIKTIGGFDPAAAYAGTKVTDDMRSQARLLLRRGKNQGFIDSNGNVNETKLQAYLDADKSQDPLQKEVTRRQVLFAREMVRNDSSTEADFRAYGTNGMLAGPLATGAGSGQWQGGTWQEQMGIGGGEGPWASPAPGPQSLFGAVAQAGGELLIKIQPAEGVEIRATKKSRRKSR